MSQFGIVRSTAASRSLNALIAVSAATLAGGLIVAPDRAADSVLIAAFAVLTVFLGGLVLLAFHYVTGARWSQSVTRVYAALAENLWIGGIAMLTVVAFRREAYAWLPPQGEHVGPFWFKAAWLDSTLLVVRAAVFVGLWSALAVAMVRNLRANRVGGSNRNRVHSAIGLLIFAPTFSLATSDWIMSIEPMWFSTVWGAYHFAGLATSTLAVVVLVALQLRRGGTGRGAISDDHLHDLGKLLLGFSCFWMYLWFCQYMLIWYSNIPEETAYFIPRTQGAWGPLMMANVALNWVVPFLALLPRPAKRSATTMARVAAIVLIGRWLDLYLMVYPSRSGEVPSWGAWETAGIVLAVAGGLRLIDFSLRRSPPLRFGTAAPAGRTSPDSGAVTV